MTRRLVTRRPAPKSAPPPERKMTPKQCSVVKKLQRGWRIMFGPTAVSHSVSGHSTYNFGEMLCEPGYDSGQRITARMLDALIERGLIEEVKRETPVDTSSLAALIRSQSTAREAYRLTPKGRTALKPHEREHDSDDLGDHRDGCWCGFKIRP